jgi:hypothetical protein
VSTSSPETLLGWAVQLEAIFYLTLNNVIVLDTNGMYYLLHTEHEDRVRDNQIEKQVIVSHSALKGVSKNFINSDYYFTKLHREQMTCESRPLVG